MTLAIDCRVLDSSGIGVFLRECLLRFNSQDVTLILIGSAEKIKKLSLKNASILECNIKTFSLKELFCFPKTLLKQINKCDAYFTPYFNIPSGIKIPVFSTIHDMIFPDMPELTSKIGLQARMFFYKRAAKKSDLIFTVSKFSEERIKYFLPKTKKTKVIYNGLSKYIINSLENYSFEEKKDDYILFVGNIKKHKGLKTLITAFTKAKQNGFNKKLFIVGNAENFRTKDTEISSLIESAPKDSIKFTGFLSDKELLSYLKNADLLVQPSLYEGFGIPPLEAMSLGTPAFISDIPVFKEIYESFPVTYFKTEDSDDLCIKLINMYKNIDNLPRINLTSEQKDKYTYDKTANLILQTIMENL